MTKIKLLPIHEAQKIAAGEVVERPASIVKELIENALDANATALTIDIIDAGSQSISITDNGCGMAREDAYLCVEQYATSKISSVEQLNTLHTFGFRGEALASIAAVSKLTIRTKEESSDHGIQLTFEQGRSIQETIVSCNTGTTIIVHDLFYNVPARKKFLKKKETEWRQILLLIHAFCLDYLNVHFKVTHDDKLILNCPSTTSLKNRLAQLGDDRAASSMIEFDQKDNDIRIHGLISDAHYFRYDRSNQFFFVNKRWVKNYALAKALMKGYMNVLPRERYPSACIFIDINPNLVDINIHPRKEEVQFLHPRTVETILQAVVKKTLEQKFSQAIKPLPESAQKPHNLQFEDYQPPRFKAACIAGTTMAMGMPLPMQQQPSAPRHQQELPAAIEPAREIIHEISFEYDHTIIGQFHKTYILIEQQDGIYCIDQHAAHERILYEQFVSRFGTIESVELLFPQVITLNEHEMIQIKSSCDLLASHGIVVETFGEQQIIVQSIPVHAKNIPLVELIKMVIALLNEYQTVEKKQLHKLIHEKLHAQMACKAAVKAGDILTQDAMQELLKNLSTTPNRFTCPHGRPTGWLLSLHELEKKFKRKL